MNHIYKRYWSNKQTITCMWGIQRISKWCWMLLQLLGNLLLPFCLHHDGRFLLRGSEKHIGVGMVLVTSNLEFEIQWETSWGQLSADFVTCLSRTLKSLTTGNKNPPDKVMCDMFAVDHFNPFSWLGSLVTDASCLKGTLLPSYRLYSQQYDFILGAWVDAFNLIVLQRTALVW